MLIPRLRNDHGELPRLALALATLSAVGFSLVLCVQLFWFELASRNSYALSNVLGAPGRNVLLLTLGAGMLLPALIGLSLFWQKGPLVIERLEYWATVLAPLSLSFVLPSLFLSQVAETKPLFYLVVLAAFGLAIRALIAASFLAQGARRAQLARQTPDAFDTLDALRGSFEQLRTSPRQRALALLLVLAAAAGYAAYFGHYAVVHHRLIQTLDT